MMRDKAYYLRILEYSPPLKSRYGGALSVEKVREKINAVDSKEIP
jgi:hypothetical protein